MPAAWRRPGVAWCGMAFVLWVGMLAGTLAPAAALEWQPATALHEPWRWWTAAFTHYSRLHLIGNLFGLALTAAFGWAARVPPSAAAAWFAAWPLTHLALWLVPDLQRYAGVSGVVHAGVAIVIAQTLVAGTRAQRFVVGCVLVGLVGKIASETPWRGAVQQFEGWDIAIAPIVHVTGIVSGSACLAAARLIHHRKPAEPP